MYAWMSLYNIYNLFFVKTLKKAQTSSHESFVVSCLLWFFVGFQMYRAITRIYTKRRPTGYFSFVTTIIIYTNISAVNIIIYDYRIDVRQQYGF